MDVIDSGGTDAKGTASSHDFVDHTSELIVRVRAPTFAELLEEGARALGELMIRSGHTEAEGSWRELAVQGSDQASLLVALLNELVYLGEVECWAPLEVEVVDTAEGGEARVRARGVRLNEPFVLVKAATLHGLSIQQVGGVLQAEVTLDV